MAYLLDSNVFISAKELHYGFDFCPAFWEWLIKNNSVGKVFSVEKVSNEIKAVGDELADWAHDRGTDFFLRPNSAMVPSFGKVSDWANNQNYTPAAVNNFLKIADYYLVAQALAHGHTVVTHEVAAATVNYIKIPNACIGLEVKCISPFDMLRIERAHFVLGPQR